MKFKDHLVGALQLLACIAIPATVSDLLNTSGHPLGGLGTLVLYAPFVVFYLSAEMKRARLKASNKKSEGNGSVPITPKMLAYTAAKVDELAPKKTTREKQLEEIAIYRHDLMEDYAQGKISEAEFAEAYDLIFEMESEAGISSLDFSKPTMTAYIGTFPTAKNNPTRIPGQGLDNFTFYAPLCTP